jgi:hypothetical protein
MKTGEERPGGRAILGGAALWAALGTVGVFLRGVRYEESLERAQALLGITPYPEGHPLYVYAHNAFGIHYPLSAWLLQLTDSDFFIAAFRDILYVLAMLVPVFLIATRLARDVRAGHLATLLVFVNSPAFFSSFYNINMWPWTYTSGEMGMGWALLTVYAVLSRAWLPAGMLLGLMPIVHIGQMPPVLAFGCLAGLYLIVQPDRAPLARYAAGVALGLLGCGLFYLYYRTQTVPLPTTGAYTPQGDAWEVWRRFTHHEDIHRRLTAPPRFGPFPESASAVAALLVIGTLAAWRAPLDLARRMPWGWVALYGVIVAGIVGGVMTAHTLLGESTPYLLIGWLPYRLTNHAALLLLAAVAAALFLPGKGQRGAMACVLIGTLALAAQYVSGEIAPLVGGGIEAITTRFLVLREGPLFFLIGAAAARLVVMSARRTIPRIVVVALAWIGLAWVHQFMAACVAAGILTFLVRTRIPNRPWASDTRLLRAACLCGALAIVQVFVQEFRTREPFMAAQGPVPKALATRGDEEAMILAPFTQLNYQIEWRHPVFATFETRYFIPYVPALAPTIEQMFADVYGVPTGGGWSNDIREAWTERSQPEWQALADRYGFRYVYFTDQIPLDLPVVLKDEKDILYHIPPADPANG